MVTSSVVMPNFRTTARDSRALKSPGPRERGVLVLDYAYVFPAFLKYFDVQRVMDEYYIVLEPSWTGYANLDLLAFSRFKSPVFIQAAEPRD